MQTTPHKISQKIDETIDGLNIRWDLQIPRLHGTVAAVGEDRRNEAQNCAVWIRALCWRDFNLDSVLNDFDEQARHMLKGWVKKPNQVEGTLVNMSISKSFIKRDPLSTLTKQGLGRTPEQNRELIKMLNVMLKEEYTLAKSSGSYARQSFTSVGTSFTSKQSDIASATTSFEQTRSFQAGPVSTSRLSGVTDAKAMAKTTAVPRKRGSDTTTGSKVKKVKTRSKQELEEDELPPQQGLYQPTVSQMFKKRTPRPGTVQRPITNETSFAAAMTGHDMTRSFESEEPSTIFSEVEVDGAFSSGNTSILSMTEMPGDRQSSRYSGGTEVQNALNDDIATNRALSSADMAPLAALLHNLAELGPFRANPTSLPAHLPFWYKYELHRVSLYLGQKEMFLWMKLTKMLSNETPSLHEYQLAIKEICKESGRDAPAKSDISKRATETNTYIDAETSQSCYFAARLNFTAINIDLEILPVNQDKSCRFHRKWGADRFMILDVPQLEENSLPRAWSRVNGVRLPNIPGELFDWLTESTHYLFGRSWRVFYAEPKEVNKNKKGTEARQTRFHLFAVDGSDFVQDSVMPQLLHERFSVAQFLDWHLNFRDNLHSTDLKLFARLQLGLSKTTPTIVLQPDEFIEVDDLPPHDEHGNVLSGGEVMTDGCGRMSYKLAQAVWASLGVSNQPMPSAFQARIAGAKGLWIVEYKDTYPDVGTRGFWIEIRPSQLKIRPHPRYRLNADPEQRTFEVVKTSSKCQPSHLNIQLLSILSNRGVSWTQLEALTKAGFLYYRDELQKAMRDAISLRMWRQSYAPSAGEFTAGGGTARIEDELDRLLEAGFEPRKNQRIIDCVYNIVKAEQDRLVEKMRIAIPLSTYAFCIPDFSGLLKPGEIQLNFSETWRDEASGALQHCLENVDVLVARNPAHLASDIQKVKAVYYHELQYIKDVVIFSTQGSVPLASILSGGDYDGDTVAIIWDALLTQDFKNVPVPKFPSKKECGLESRSKALEYYFAEVIGDTGIELFIKDCCLFNSNVNNLGIVTEEFARVTYARSNLLQQPFAIKLAALAGYLVDSSKQGDVLSEDNWNSLRKEIRGEHKRIVPERRVVTDVAYKNSAVRASRPMKMRNGNSVSQNVIDYLKFEVIENMREEMLTWYDKQYQKSASKSKDLQLRKLFVYEMDRALEYKNSGEPQLHAVLRQLRRDLETLHGNWDTGVALVKRQNRDFSEQIRKSTEELRGIVPWVGGNNENVGCDLVQQHLREGDDIEGRWSLLRASCLFQEAPRVAWYLCLPELCRINVRLLAGGTPSCNMTLQMRNYMKADTKKHKKMLKAQNDDTNNDET